MNMLDKKIDRNFKQLIRVGFNLLGFDIIKRENNPKYTLLGLRDRPIHTIIDVGANVGQFARYISKFYPKAMLYCFEPLPEPFNLLEKWANTQKGRVQTFKLAIGDKEGDSEMYLHEDHSPSSSLLSITKVAEQQYPFTKNQRRIIVRQIKLDNALHDFMNEMALEILIKLDVQGYENKVIAGGGGIFSKATACVLEVNLDKLYLGQAGFLELLMMLNALNYEYVGNLAQSYGKDGHCIFLEAVFINRQKLNHTKLL